MALQNEILEGTIRVFNRKGMKFTMDDIAHELGISKKTIYTVFSDKQELVYNMVDYCFDSIKESEEKVLKNGGLSTVEKIRGILGVLPEGYKDIDFSRLYILKDKYPKVYARVEERLESGWDTTIFLLEQGMREGVIRKVDIALVKVMFEATLEQFFKRDVLVRNKISYSDALSQVVEIICKGIEKRREPEGMKDEKRGIKGGNSAQD